MEKEISSVEPEKLRITTSLQFIILVLTSTFTLGGLITTFYQTSSQVNKLQDKVEILNTSISNKIDIQNREIQNQFIDLHKATSRIEGKLELLSRDRVK